MAEEEKKNGTPDPRLMPRIRIEIDQGPDGIAMKGNVPPHVCIQVLTEAIIMASRQGWVKQDEALVKPVVGAMPPLRRI